MRTKVLAILIALACLLITGCKKDAEIKTLLTDFDSFTDELVKRVDAASDPSAPTRRISWPGNAVPHDPGLRSWSSGRSTVLIPVSVAP